jgi:hypothetical protein
VPVVDAGIPREVVDAARDMVSNNRPSGRTGRRSWELPSKAVRCGGCGTSMRKYASQAGGRIYAYYKCSRLIRFGKDGCSPDRLKTNHRAEEVERRVWEFVSDLMKDPERLREDLDRMIELEKKASRGDPEREAKAWLDKLTEVDGERRGYIKLAAKGHISEAELEVELAELHETRETAHSELAAIQNRRETIEQLER